MKRSVRSSSGWTTTWLAAILLFPAASTTPFNLISANGFPDVDTTVAEVFFRDDIISSTKTIIPYPTSDDIKFDEDTIPIINCDDFPSSFDPPDAPLVLLFSANSDHCRIEGSSLSSMRAATITDRNQVQHIIDSMEGHYHVEVVLRQFQPPISTSYLWNELKKRETDEHDEKNHQRPSMMTPGFQPNGPNTNVALIILYSITGVITFLFLLIILTGAVRAHRHPERYGQRVMGPGQQPQSRMRGLGRAVLDTIPVVRFKRTDDSPVVKDLEMQNNEMSDTTENDAARHSAAVKEPERRSLTVAVGERDVQEEAIPPPPPTAVLNREDLECPVCMEEFEEGQDLRVLPCSHHFHKDCIDEWLLTIAGSCPLCRTDLHPDFPSEDEEATPQESTSAPVSPIRRFRPPGASTRLRFSRFLDIVRGGMEGEERARAIRELQEQHRQEGIQPARRSILLDGAMGRMRRISRRSRNMENGMEVVSPVSPLTPTVQESNEGTSAVGRR